MERERLKNFGCLALVLRLLESFRIIFQNNQSFNETGPMKRSTLPYGESLHKSNPVRYGATRPKAGSLNEEMEQRIVMLHASGQSVASITREVGRARHLIVHILQSRGVFASSQAEKPCGPEAGPARHGTDDRHGLPCL
jgi:hypothetical protein